MEEELDWTTGEEEHQGQGAQHQEEEAPEEGLDVGLPGGEEPAGGDHHADEEEPAQLERAGSMTPTASPEREAPADGRPPATASGAAAAQAAPSPADANGEAVPDEWQVMDVPEEWRPRPMIRAWGLPAATTEDELAQLLQEHLAGTGHAVRSVVIDPRQTTGAGKVALVRFQPPPLPEEQEAAAAAAAGEGGASGAGPPAAAEADVGKVAEGIIAALRAAAPELHGAKVNVEKTGAEVRLPACLPNLFVCCID